MVVHSCCNESKMDILFILKHGDFALFNTCWTSIWCQITCAWGTVLTDHFMQTRHLSNIYIVTSLIQNYSSNLQLKCSISSIQAPKIPKNPNSKILKKCSLKYLWWCCCVFVECVDQVCNDGMVAIKTVEFISAYRESFALPKGDIQSQVQSFL